MKECNNFFISSIEYGDFIIKDGILTVNDKYLIGQYIYIPGRTNMVTHNPQGSILNDGVYLVNDNLITLKCVANEEWTGAVCGLAVPRDFISLVNEIDNYSKAIESDPQRALITSERVGNYSVTMATGQNGLLPTWQSLFNSRLAIYRRMFEQRIF